MIKLALELGADHRGFELEIFTNISWRTNAEDLKFFSKFKGIITRKHAETLGYYDHPFLIEKMEEMEPYFETELKAVVEE